jgi:hypothetical protein
MTDLGTRRLRGVLICGSLPLLLAAACHRSVAPSASDIPGSSSIRTAALPSADAAAVRFRDVTRSAGIRFVATSSKTPNKYMIETIGSGCGFVDFDNDGNLDILLLNGAPLAGGAVTERPTQKLYRNNGNGTFTDVTHKAGLDVTAYAMGCAVGDYDNDGFDDLYITCGLGPSRLFHNNGNGTFTDVTQKAGVDNERRWGTSCAWLDMDNDGHLDLFVCNYVVYRTLADDVPCFARAGVRSYCVPSAYRPTHCALYRNKGDGTFTDVSRESGIGAIEAKALGVAVWDYDDDGLPDLFVACDTTPGLLLHNLGGSRFEELGVQSGIAYDEQGNPHNGMGIDVAEPHNNGRASMVLTNYSGNQVSLYEQAQAKQPLFVDNKTASGVGPPSTAYLGWGAGFMDCDDDGLLDIFVLNGHVADDISEKQPNLTYAEKPMLYQNQGGGTFREVGIASGAPPFTIPLVGRGAAWGDFDNDGKTDLMMTCNNGPAYLWHNETATMNHWITVKLVGTRSNRDGIGATVTTRAGGVTHTAYIRSGSSYLSASDRRAHFGLGASTRAEIEVRWPSGAVDRIPSAVTDRAWTLVEGSGTLR